MEWNPDFDQKQLLELLQQIKKKPGDDRGMFVSLKASPVSFYGGAIYEDLTSLLLTAADFALDIPYESRRAILQDALFETAESGALTPAKLRSEISKKESLYEKAPRSKYTIWSSLSIKHTTALKLIRKNNQTLQFYREWPSKIINSQNWQRVRDAIGGDIPLSFTPIRIRVTARDGNEAVYTAFELTDLLRGIWNFVLNRSRSWRMPMNASPINSIRLGPGHFLDHISDPLANTYWYEPSYYFPSPVYDAGNQWQVIRKREQDIRRKLSRLSYQSTLENAFRQYARALDEHDTTSAFLKLWPMLEHLTGISTQRALPH